MRAVRLAHKFCTRLATKIEEGRSIATVISQRHITSLFAAIPDGIDSIKDRFPARGYSSTQKSRARNSKLLCRTHAAMISAIKELFGLAKLAIVKRHLPCARCSKSFIVLVICGTSHIDNRRIAIFQKFPARDSGIFNIQLDKVRTRCIQVAHINARYSTQTFNARAIRHALAIWRDIGVISLLRIVDFDNGNNATSKINKGQIARYVIAEHKLGFKRSRQVFHFENGNLRLHDRFLDRAVFVKPGSVGNFTKSKPKSKIVALA